MPYYLIEHYLSLRMAFLSYNLIHINLILNILTHSSGLVDHDMAVRIQILPS